MTDHAPTSGSPDEEAVRRYLQFLAAPESFLDEGRVRSLRDKAGAADDVLERARLLAEAYRAENVDEAPLVAGFTAHAKAWADDAGIPAAVLSEMGVPDAVLADAGFEPDTRPRARKGSSRRSPSSRGRRVSTEEIREHVRSRTAPFTLKDVAGGLGGSPMTIRKAVEDLVAAGEVERLGPVPDYRGRGRAPVQYRTKA